MLLHLYPALVTCLALLLYAWICFTAGRARERCGIAAPATTGHPDFERRFRIQQNTVEQLVLFLPSLWLFSLLVSQLWGLVLGLVWVAARLGYAISYARDPAKRGPAFTIAMIAALILLLGSLVQAIWYLAAGIP